MKRIFKIILGLIGGALLLLILAAIALPMIYDEEDLKLAIADQVHKQTGRELQIDGALHFSVFPWLAVDVGDLRLGNAEGFGDQPFARVGKARVGIALMPLFSKRLVADEVTLDGLQLALAVDQQGRNNWDDLGGEAKDQGADTAGKAGRESELFSSQSIAGVNIRDARIDYQDRQSGSALRLSDFSMQTGSLGDGKPVPVELSGLFEDPGAGLRLKLGLSTTAALNLKTNNHTFNDVELDITRLPSGSGEEASSQGQSVTIRAPQVSAGLDTGTLALEAFTVILPGLSAAGSLKGRDIFGKPAFDGALQTEEFSPRELLQALSMAVPVTADPDVLQRARFSASITGSSSEVSFGNVQAVLDQSELNGEISVRNFERPGVRFDFDVDEIDVDRYLEPAGGEADSTTDVAMPEQALKGLDVQGQLRVGALQLGGLRFSKAVVGVQIMNGKLRLNPLTAGFYDGSYSGDIKLDTSGDAPVLSLDEKLDSVTFQRLVADITDNQNLSGLAQGHVRLSGRGTTSNEVLGSLAGDLGLTLNEGALEGVNVWYEIRRGYALYKGLTPPQPEPKRTVFSRMQLAATVDKGVLTTRELTADLPFLSIRGNGTVNLAQSDVDLRLTAVVRNAPELAQDPLAADLQGKQLPFKVSGLLTEPSISVDWTKLLKSEAAGMLLDKLGLKPEAADSADEKSELSDEGQTKEAAKGLLLDLLGGKKKKQDKQ